MKIKVSLEGVDKHLLFQAAIKKQLPYSIALALTRIAQAVQADIKKEMQKSFNSPTRWTLNSLRIEAARKGRLQAVVAVKDRVSRGNPALFWIAPEVHGGDRRDKRAEAILKAANMLPSGMQAVPGRQAALNRFGNMTKASVVKAVQGAQAAESGEQQDGRTKYFVMRKSGQPIGIAARFSKSRMGMVMSFVDSARYQERLDYYGVGHKTVKRVREDELNKAIKHAIETAK